MVGSCRDLALVEPLLVEAGLATVGDSNGRRLARDVLDIVGRADPCSC